MSERHTAICPGSYDPVTNGHLDIISRTATVFEHVIVAVVNQPVRKSKTLFSADERKAFLDEAIGELGLEQLFCHAQSDALAFYERLGWRVTSDEFVEAGIPHRRMTLLEPTAGLPPEL